MSSDFLKKILREADMAVLLSNATVEHAKEKKTENELILQFYEKSLVDIRNNPLKPLDAPYSEAANIVQMYISIKEKQERLDATLAEKTLVHREKLYAQNQLWELQQMITSEEKK
jgi:hypothetical protein